MDLRKIIIPVVNEDGREHKFLRLTCEKPSIRLKERLQQAFELIEKFYVIYLKFKFR